MENTDRQDDHEILALSIRNPSVFSSIVDRYQEPFIRKVLGVVGSRDDAEDIVQEAFVKIYLNAKKFEKREDKAFSSWAYKILLNTCFSHLKKHKALKKAVSLDESFGLDFEAEKEDESIKERFLIVLSKIPVSCAKILRLVVIEGKSYEDIAKIEGIKDSAVRVRIHRAKSEFKKALIENPNL